LVKVEQYINNLISQNLNEDESLLLEQEMQMYMSSDVLMNYFLAFFDYKIIAKGSNQLCFPHKAFVVLKDKYLNILCRIDSNDISVTLVGLLLHTASRIYYVIQMDEEKRDLVSLIEHLDCPIMKEFKIWEIYFIHRVSRGQGMVNILSKSHPLYSVDSNEKLIQLGDPTFRHVVRLVKENESMHNVALKEIAYYLILLKNMSEKATEILLKIYVKYSIDKKLMESILSIHKACAGAFIQDRIEDIVDKSNKDRRRSSNMCDLIDKGFASNAPAMLEVVFSKTLPFLDMSSTMNLIYTALPLYRRLKPLVFEKVLSGTDVTHKLRSDIYRQMIPLRYAVC
jgi:hypothetical protein